MTSSLVQPAFSRGEIGPELSSRTDLAAYQIALAKCINWIVSPYGGVLNRPGTQFIGQTAGNEVARLIRFKFNSSDTYALEFTHLKMRVIRNGGYVNAAIVSNGRFQSNISGWTLFSGGAAWDSTSKAARLQTVSGAPGKIYQTISNLVVGETYTLTLNSDITAGGFAKVGPTADSSAVLNKVLAIGANTATFVAGATSYVLTLANSGGADTLVDNVYISGPVSGGPLFELTTTYTRDELFELVYTQSADVMEIVHPSHRPAKLKRFNHDSWTLEEVSLVPSIAAPASATATSNSGTGTVQTWAYQITAVKDEGATNTEESLPATSNGVSIFASAPQGGVTWPAVAGATYYNVYKDNAGSGVFGFIGRSTTTAFTDNNITPTKTDTPPTGTDPFIGAGNYPSAVAYFQQRLVYASTNNKPQTLWFSRTGVFTNYGYSFPTKDDDAITWTMASNEVNRIKHIVPLRALMTFTDGAEWIIQGQSSGFTPKTINGDPQTYNGIGQLRPLVLNNTAIYAQERGRTVTAFGYTLEADGYSGNDISVLSPQMLQEYGLVDWDYQKIPYSIVWGAREDGAMTAITYLAEQQVIGWHRHYTDGKVLSVCSVPEGRSDAVYLCVERIVNGSTVRYIERMAERQLPRYNGDPLIQYSWFLDCALRYDGVNMTSETMTITGGTAWQYPEQLTVTSSNPSRFSAGDVGDSIQYLETLAAEPVRFLITGYVSGSSVLVRPIGSVPEAIRGVAFMNWAIGRDTLSGLSHLEGKEVTVLADGNVYRDITVTGGSIQIDTPAAVVLVGLPYESELQTLEISVPNSETLKDKAKMISSVSAVLLESRGGFYGTKNDENNLFEFKQRDVEDDYGAIRPLTGVATQAVIDRWTGNGQVTVVQKDPLPINILALIPRAEVGGAT